jgi:hypothetical protein
LVGMGWCSSRLARRFGPLLLLANDVARSIDPY